MRGQKTSVGHIFHKLVILLVIFSFHGEGLEHQIDSSKISSKYSSGTRTLLRSRRQAQHCLSNCPALWKENWGGHGTQLYRVYVNKINHVVVYFDPSILDGITQKNYNMVDNQIQSLQENPHWIFDFVSDVWRYMTKTYGSFGPDPYLYFVLHRHGHYQEHYIHYSLDPKNSKSVNKRNILDISSLRDDSWVNVATMSEEKDLITNKLAYFVEYSSKERWGSPAHDVWRRILNTENAWADIFTYDVYQNLNMINDANRLSKNLVTKYENGPKAVTFWFRDWFLPIYSQHGNGSLLNAYLDLLKVNVPSVGNRYSQILHIGSFVHFWSAAASTDLRFQARTAFGWNETYQEQFAGAVERFPGLTGLYKISSECCSIADPTVAVTTPFAVKHDISLIHSNGSERGDDLNLGGMKSESPGASRSSENNEQIIGSSSTEHTTQKGSEMLEKSNVVILVSVGAAIILALVVVLIASFILYKRKLNNLQMEIRALTPDEVNEFFEGDPNVEQDDTQAVILSMPFIKAFEIPREQMVLDTTKVLGTGQFGSVLHGYICADKSDPMNHVAIKTVKKNVDVIYFKAFLSEVKIMAYLGQHANIVELVGTCTDNIKNREILIALEFCSLGGLDSYLKKNRNLFETLKGRSTENTGECEEGISMQILSKHGNNASDLPQVAKTGAITTLDLLRWSQDVSNAMKYLTDKKVIHGDLAARNILLTEHRVAKVSDFGLSRQFLNYANYMKTSKLPVPWRWLAIESLKDMKFSTASDVWAFGVTLWEIFSLAETPYGLWTYDLFFVDRLMDGDRLLKPAHASEHLYQLMKDCWEVEPTQRPTFEEIYDRLEKLVLDPVGFCVTKASDVTISGFEMEAESKV